MRKTPYLSIVLAIWAAWVAAPAAPAAGGRPGGFRPALQGGCQVTGVEPGRISPLTGGTLSIYGEGFVAGTAVRLVRYGVLSANVINATAIVAVVPAGIAVGTYDLELILPDNTSCLLTQAVKIRLSPSERPTATPQPSYTSAFGQPQLVIESAATRPETIRPGSTFTLTLQVVNRGDYTAANVRILLGAGGIAVPKGGSNLTVIDQIPKSEAVEVSLPLVLAEGAPSGYQALALSLEYSDVYSRDYQSSQSVGVSVTAGLSDQPLVLLTAYHTRPASLSPGEAFTLVLELTNAGDSQAVELLLTLGGENPGEVQTFAILDSGNVKLVPRLAAGQSIELEQRFIVDGSASAGVYVLPVTLAYESLTGERRTEKQALNLLVNRRPQIQVDFYREVPPGLAGQPLELPIELVNIGRTAANVSTAEILGGNLEIERGSAFIGALDGGTTASLDAVVVPQASGDLPVTVLVHYLDDFNQPQVITQTLTIHVEAPEPTPSGEAQQPAQVGEGPLSWLGKILRGLLGLGS